MQNCFQLLMVCSDTFTKVLIILVIYCQQLQLTLINAVQWMIHSPYGALQNYNLLWCHWVSRFSLFLLWKSTIRADSNMWNNNAHHYWRQTTFSWYNLSKLLIFYKLEWHQYYLWYMLQIFGKINMNLSTNTIIQNKLLL